MAKVKTSDEFFAEFTSQPVETAAVEPIKEEVQPDIVLEDEADETPVDGGAVVEEGSQEEPEKEQELKDDDETVESEEGIIFADDEEVIVEEPDYVRISQELGFEGIKNKEQLVSKYKQDLEKAKEDALDGLPENLKEAVLFAKEGGDFMAVLEANSIDYDKVSNRELVEAKYHKYFLDDDNNFDKDAFDSWIDTEGKAKINMLADQIRSEEKYAQRAKLASIKENTAREKEKLNAALKTELDRIDSIGGVKLTQSQKDSMFKDTVSGIAMEELFYEGGKISNKKLAQNLFKVRMFDKAIQIAKTSAKNDGKREVISRATNASVQRRAERPVAEIKKVSPMDQFFESLKNKK